MSQFFSALLVSSFLYSAQCWAESDFLVVRQIPSSQEIATISKTACNNKKIPMGDVLKNISIQCSLFKDKNGITKLAEIFDDKMLVVSLSSPLNPQGNFQRVTVPFRGQKIELQF